MDKQEFNKKEMREDEVVCLVSDIVNQEITIAMDGGYNWPCGCEE